MDDVTATQDVGVPMPQRSVFDNDSESYDQINTEDWQRLVPRYQYQLKMREEKAEDIFFGGQMCE